MHKLKPFLRSAVSILTSLLCLGSQAQTTHPAITLNVGDPAPALKVSGWFKGTPTESFSPGKVYVVEFWATWCGPCKRMIPHLTEMAKSHLGKATFIGVSVWEHPDEQTDASIASLVTPFIKKMGDQMDYNVAADGIDHYMDTHWMKAAGQDGIPTAFVIGKDQHVAWVGSPADLEPVLNQVIANKWDVVAEQKRAADEQVDRIRENELTHAIIAARKVGDYKATLVAVDKIQAEFPKFVGDGDLISIRLEALLHIDKTEALLYIKTLTDKDGLIAKKPVFVFSVLRMFPKESSPETFNTQQWKTVADECEPMVAVDKTISWTVYSDYAVILRRAGEIHEAVQYQKKAVDLASEWAEAHKETLRLTDKKSLNANKDLLAELTALDK